MAGSVSAIFISAQAGSPMDARERVTLVAGKGIEGDRYFVGTGTFSPETQDPDHQLTLIASEEVDRFNRENELNFEVSEFRRNVVTQGIDLESLVGIEFHLGSVTLRGIRLCEPCRLLSSKTDRRLPKAMLHKAGLRAEIVSGGELVVGDPLALP